MFCFSEDLSQELKSPKELDRQPTVKFAERKPSTPGFKSFGDDDEKKVDKEEKEEKKQKDEKDNQHLDVSEPE